MDGALAKLSDVAAALVGCGHVSGLLRRPVWLLNRTPHCLNRALAIDFCITHFEVIF